MPAAKTKVPICISFDDDHDDDLKNATLPWGSETSIRLRSPRYDRLWSLVYVFIRTLLAFFMRTSRHDRDDGAKDLEILVLRHQLRVLQRTAGRPKLQTIDRVPANRLLAILILLTRLHVHLAIVVACQ